jgi:hypothetical protein
MIYAIVLTSPLLAIALAAALVREHRLRRALERLLKRLITAWSAQNADTESARRLADLPADSPSDDRLYQTARRASD